MNATIANAPIRETAKQAMYSTALEFSEDVVKATDPLLIEIFGRIERGESTHEQEEAILMKQWNEMMEKRAVSDG